MGLSGGRRPSIEHCQTLTPLAAAGVYASTWQQVRLYPIPATATSIPVVWDRNTIRGKVLADQASAANGFQIEFADRDDFTDATIVYQVALVANVALVFSQALNSRWVRLLLTNGGVAQGILVLTANLEDD